MTVTRLTGGCEMASVTFILSLLLLLLAVGFSGSKLVLDLPHHYHQCLYCRTRLSIVSG